MAAPPYQLPASVAGRLSPSDRVLFGKLMQVGLEAAWAAVTAEGYSQCFINELRPLNTGRRMVGRARTIRYLPNRKDLRDKIYSQGPQLNYRSAEEAQPGDVLVFDADSPRVCPRQQPQAGNRRPPAGAFAENAPTSGADRDVGGCGVGHSLL